jgi:hypothetical protein
LITCGKCSLSIPSMSLTYSFDKHLQSKYYVRNIILAK